MENPLQACPYIDDLVAEYLVFRGFTFSLQTFKQEEQQDKLRGFQVDKIVSRLNSFVTNHDIEALLELWEFLESRFFTQPGLAFANTSQQLETALYRLYVVTALRGNKPEKVHQMFEMRGHKLFQRDEWKPWFAITFIQEPWTSPDFAVYFTEDWYVAFIASLRNYLHTVFSTISPPQLLNFEAFQRERKALIAEKNALQEQVDALETDNDRLKLQIDQLKKQLQTKSLSPPEALDHSTKGPTTSMMSGTIAPPSSTATNPPHHRRTPTASPIPAPFVLSEQRLIAGHSGPVSQCRFSNTGFDFATGASDSTIRIWSTEKAGDQSIMHFESAEVCALEWETKDRYLFYGLTNQQVKVWSVEDKQVAAVLTTSPACPIISEIVSSPVVPVCVVSASSVTPHKGELIAWNWHVNKIERRFDIDPLTSVVSATLNHNGTILVVGGADGMVRMYDMLQQSSILGWKMHSSPVVSVHFTRSETSVLSFGADGKMTERGLHNYAITNSDFGFQRAPNLPRWQCRVRFDPNMEYFVTNSPNGRADVYELSTTHKVLEVEAHQGPVLACDWHPIQNAILTTGSDQCVRLNSLAAMC